MAKLLRGSRSHLLGDKQSLDTVTSALRPLKKNIKTVLKRVEKRRGKKGGWSLRRQRGGAIFSTIVAGLIPLLADIIIRAVSGGKAKSKK